MGRAAHENSYQIPVFYYSSLEKKTELTTYKMSISGSIKRLIPLFDRIVVQRVEAATKTKGGILIPEQAKGKVLEGTVVAAGPGARNDRGGTKLEFDKQEYALFRESDIVAKLGKE